MILVLDASAAMEVALGSAKASACRDALSRSDLVLAPDLFASEITHGFWNYAQYGHMSVENGEAAVDGCLDLIDDFIPTRLFAREVFLEATRLRHPSYDVFYLVTARRHNAHLLTVDPTLARLAATFGVRLAFDPN